MTYETKDSGARTEYDSGMVRDLQDGKARHDLCIAEGIPYEEQMLTRFARLMERGAIKYGDRNWEKASSFTELDRFKSSAYRHFMQWFCDVQDGEDHAAAVMFNLTAHESTLYKMRQPVRCEVEYSQVETMPTESNVTAPEGYKLIHIAGSGMIQDKPPAGALFRNEFTGCWAGRGDGSIMYSEWPDFAPVTHVAVRMED